MKVRIRDRKLPLKQKTKKFKPLRLKNMILKWALGLSFAINLLQLYLKIKS